MLIDKEKYEPFDVVLKTLQSICKQRRSGTLYLYTDEGHGATITMAFGKIFDIGYLSTRGMKALDHLSKITKARMLFKSDPVMQVKVQEFTEYLPSINVILKKLGLETESDPAAKWMGEDIKTILLVEDSAMARKSILNAFAGKSYEIIEAKDGLEALHKLPKVLPDLVLLDLILPHVDGYEVLQAMKDDVKYDGIPVIVLTSRDALFDKIKGRLSGVDEYITKPVDVAKLRSKVDKYLGHNG